MSDIQVIAYSISSFICALFVLEYGADKFIDHTAIVAERIGVSQGVIGLLTAGAEWEELAVVVISIARRRSSLAIGNIVGSCISNILGAFSLGLMFQKNGDQTVFDRSSKIYALILLLLTITATVVSEFGNYRLWRIAGVIAIGFFLLYVVSIAYLIRKERMAAPVLSDSDSNTDSSSNYGAHESPRDQIQSADRAFDPGLFTYNADMAAETSPLLDTPSPGRNHKHSIAYHISFLILGMFLILLSSYVLSTAASNLIDETGISDVLFGVVILSIATTLPEKFVAVISGRRGHTGILVANTVGSNIFLLSLCLGIVWASTGGSFDNESVNTIELSVMCCSTLALALTVWCGARFSRGIGSAMLLCYIIFLILEFTVIRKT